MKILILAEHDNQVIKPPTFHAVSAAQELNGEIDLLLIGNHCEKATQNARRLNGIHRVIVADNEVYGYQLAENTAALLCEIGESYEYILAGTSTFSKNILPRYAALQDVEMLSDVCKIISHDTFMRPIYAGNILATIQCQEKIKIMTIRCSAFLPVEVNTDPCPNLEFLSTIIANDQAKFLNQSLTKSDRPDLLSAHIIISGGRGLKNAESFKQLEELADRLGAAIGASRAAVDAGFAPNDYQVGQTGKIVAPDLYIAIGISGAIQHLAGMKESKYIVAINNDPDAPIFQVSDYILIGDLFKILPELNSELDKLKALTESK